MSLNTATLRDGTAVFCLSKPEAQVLDEHVEGYLQHGIELHEDALVFDVGANIGIFGARLCQRYKNLRVLAFEPIPDIYRVAAANAERFGPGRYQVFNYGLSDQAGELNFTYYPNAPALSTAHPEDWSKAGEFESAVKGSLRTAPMWYARFVPSFLTKFIAKRLTANGIEVRCPLRTVSEVIAEMGIERIDLLKIDCEGAEFRVLQGIQAQDWPKIQQLVIEVHDVEGRLEAITQLLKDQGFKTIYREQEAGFEDTTLCNLFVLR